MNFPAWEYFEAITKADKSMQLRDMEPLVGRFLCMSKPEDTAIYQNWINEKQASSNSEFFRRGGYLLELLGYYGPYSELWTNTMLSQSGWLMLSSINVDKKSVRIPFYPNDQRTNNADEMVLRWHLSSGVLHDRIKKLTRPPYVC